MRTLVACIVLLLAAVNPTLGQIASDTTGHTITIPAPRTITIPAPENGIIYIRSGVPGGVRIRSRHTLDGPAPRREARPPVDLERLARVFDRRGLGLYAERARVGGTDVFILRDSTSGQPADTLSLAEATDLVEGFGTQLEGVGRDEEARGDIDLVTRIERSLLDIGLFRTLQVNFEFDRSDLLVSSLGTLEAVADVLARYPALRIEVAGHTDSAGLEAYNEALSRRRAERVTAYLVELDVDLARLQAAGYGEGRPLLSNATSTGRALNRRVEFRVLGGFPAVEREER